MELLPVEVTGRSLAGNLVFPTVNTVPARPRGPVPPSILSMNPPSPRSDPPATGSCPECGEPLQSRGSAAFCPHCLLRQGLVTETGAGGESVAEPRSTKEPPPVPDFDEVVRCFPGFEILECLGRGGMGVVYKARQRALDRLVALKILAPEREKDPEFAERFSREARTLAQLNHPNIVTVYESGESRGVFYFAMELIDGVSLRHLIADRLLTPEEAIAIIPGICDALQYAHDNGVVHRDIKPENLLLDKSGRIKVADFGISQIMKQGNDCAGIPGEKHQAAGTPKYMAPEQRDLSMTVDHRADIYSLGVVFYELLTGELPRDDLQPRSSRPGLQINVRLDQVVLRALEKAPERRYQHASEIQTAVETVAGNRQTASETSNGQPSAKRRLGIAATLLGLVAATAGIAIVTIPREQDSPESAAPAGTTPAAEGAHAAPPSPADPATATPVREEIDRRSAVLTTINRVSVFSYTVPDELAGPGTLTVVVTGQIDGTALIADRPIGNEVDLQFSLEIDPGESFDFEFIPVTATEGELQIEYNVHTDP
jgi:serine/threonine protein kinase